MTDGVPAAVVIPTIGRLAQLRQCLASLTRCDPRPAEVLVIDQGDGDGVGEVTAGFPELDPRAVPCAGRGIGLGLNLGLQSARFDPVLVTHDDCTVAPDWVSTALQACSNPCPFVTGRVLPVGDPRAVPSTIEETAPREYGSHESWGVLFPNNMLLSRSVALGIGGFDERVPFAEDNDFCYRWLRSGGRLRYEPSMVVWHHEWRSADEIERLYVDYAYGSGFVYGKHLRLGDLGVLRSLSADVRAGVRAEGRALLARQRQWWDWRLGLLRGLPQGLADGWRTYGRRRLEPERR